MGELYNDEFLQEENEPHYVIYREQLDDRIIQGIEKLSGIKYTSPHYYFTPKLDENDFLPPRGWFSEKCAIAELISRIIKSGLKETILQYLDYEISELTLELKEHPTPTEFYSPDDEDDFWEECWNSDHEENIGISRQRKEVKRQHRRWLVELRRLLFVEPVLKDYPGKNQDNSKGNKRKLTQAALALFYFYRQQMGEYPDFSEFGGIKKASMAVRSEYGFSHTKFELVYNKMIKRHYRLNEDNKSQPKHITIAIDLLQENPAANPKALALAKDELATLERKIN